MCLSYCQKVLVFCYTSRKVRWGNTIYSSFKVGNGVKQGGIITCIIHIYMDKLSIVLNDTLACFLSRS